MNTYRIIYNAMGEFYSQWQDITASSSEEAVKNFYHSTPYPKDKIIMISVGIIWEDKANKAYYMLYENGTAELFGVNRDRYHDETVWELYIPDTVEVTGVKYTVTSIGEDALRGHEYLKRIHFPKGLNTLKRSALDSCGVEEIIIDSWLTSIEYRALHDCQYLRRLHIKTTESITELKGITIGREDTVIVSNSPEAYEFYLNDWICFPYSEEYYSPDELSKGIKPHLTLVLDGAVSLNNYGLGSGEFESMEINVEPKVTISLNKSKVEIILDSFNRNEWKFDNLKITGRGLEILTSQKDDEFSMEFNPQEISEEEIDINGISDFSDFNFD